MKVLPALDIPGRPSDVKILVRGDSHYGRDEAMEWCEETPGVDYQIESRRVVILRRDRCAAPARKKFRRPRAIALFQVNKKS